MTAECHSPSVATPVLHAPAANLACDVCHSEDAGGHRFPLRRPVAELCGGCHNTASLHPEMHNAVAGDSCLNCHRPHNSGERSLLIGSSVGQTCESCHAQDDGIVHHAPYEQRRCEACHEPHGSGSTDLLRGGTVTESCRTCHSSTVEHMERASHSHLKVEGACMGCHAPHAARERGMLVAPSRESCVSCHKEVGSAVAGATVSHDAVLKGEQCVRCHDPHASEHPGMLRASQADVCLACHDTPVTAADGRTIPSMSALRGSHGSHKVTGHDKCSNCHSVHGGNHARLLREVNDRVPLGAYDARNYALCFSCHDSRLADSPASTQFRDGDRNMHEVHLRVGDRSRGCASCHAVHADGEVRFIPKQVNFEGSGWSMPMAFTLTADGGRCGSGCHEPMEYSRRPGGARAPKNGEAR